MKTVYYEHFKNLEVLLDTMENRELNAVFQKKDELTSQRVNIGGTWSGTETYEECMQVLRNGYKEPLDNMKKAVLKVGNMDNYVRPKAQNDFVGFVPNVPNTLMGLPMTMINRQKNPQKAKTIHLTYSFCVSSNVKTNDMIKAGTTFIGLVNSLEKQGYRVKIDMLACFTSDKNSMVYTVNLKEYSQTLNLLKLSFPLVHPSMLRRISFKWLETVPNLKDKDFMSGYGYPLSAIMRHDGTKESEYLKSNGVMKGENSYYCNAYQAMKAENIEQLANKIGLVR
jgi:hypothetical protein